MRDGGTGTLSQSSTICFLQFFNNVYRDLDNMSSYLLNILEQRNELKAEMEYEYHSNL